MTRSEKQDFMNVLTIDLEEWFIYNLYPKGGKDYYLPIINKYLDDMLELMDKNNLKATFFCLGSIAREYPGVIKKIASLKHDIGCHSDIHTCVYDQTPESFRVETKNAIDSLEQLLGQKVNMYRAPAFSIRNGTVWALEILASLGIEYDCSVFPARRDNDSNPIQIDSEPVIIKTSMGDIKEFPVSFYNIARNRIVFSGGGYFRLFPYLIIKRLLNKSAYNMVYMHIRDLDSKQKRVYSSKYFKSYMGIKGAYPKFIKLLNQFELLSVSQVSEKTDWTKVKTISLQ